MPEKLRSENVNNTFFKGHYKEIWRQIFPEKTTQAETDFIFNDARLKNGDHALDLMCGYGRHSFELASKGVNITAVDNSDNYINEITSKVQELNLTIESVCCDLLEFKPEKIYDVAICMGNSLQFFNEEDLSYILENISAQMRTGGRFYLNTWSIAEIIYKNFKDKSWSRINDLLFLTESRICFQPARMETNSIIISENGEREEKLGIDYIYSISELEILFNQSGFKLIEVYSIPGKKIFTAGEPRAYFVFEKNHS